LSRSDAEAAAQALRLLATEAQRERDALDATEFDQFKELAKAWRDLQVKPQLPEEVRRHRVIAENAIKEKDFDKAADEYKAALKIFPCWPEGQFNLAYIAGENHYFRDAILHMKFYLELVPDAPDAQAGKDKIAIWQDKIQTNFSE
jgi:tetratricopeptide (TPR) repeat protein